MCWRLAGNPRYERSLKLPSCIRRWLLPAIPYPPRPDPTITSRWSQTSPLAAYGDPGDAGTFRTGLDTNS